MNIKQLNLYTSVYYLLLTNIKICSKWGPTNKSPDSLLYMYRVVDTVLRITQFWGGAPFTTFPTMCIDLLLTAWSFLASNPGFRVLLDGARLLFFPLTVACRSTSFPKMAVAIPFINFCGVIFRYSLNLSYVSKSTHTSSPAYICNN